MSRARRRVPSAASRWQSELAQIAGAGHLPLAAYVALANDPRGRLVHALRVDREWRSDLRRSGYVSMRANLGALGDWYLTVWPWARPQPSMAYYPARAHGFHLTFGASSVVFSQQDPLANFVGEHLLAAVRAKLRALGVRY